MATLKHVPKGRGYDYNLGYLDGVNNYWNHMMGEDGGYSPPVPRVHHSCIGWSPPRALASAFAGGVRHKRQ